jgi:hypothetical protein
VENLNDKLIKDLRHELGTNFDVVDCDPKMCVQSVPGFAGLRNSTPFLSAILLQFLTEFLLDFSDLHTKLTITDG